MRGRTRSHEGRTDRNIPYRVQKMIVVGSVQCIAATFEEELQKPGYSLAGLALETVDHWVHAARKCPDNRRGTIQYNSPFSQEAPY